MQQPIGKRLQQGAALVVALIILLVVTLLGVTGINNSSTELKLATAAQNRALTFEGAEAALKATEVTFQEAANLPKLVDFYNTCNGAQCYTEACNAGRCFKGDFDGSDIEVCTPLRLNAPMADYWDNPAFWGQLTQHYMALPRMSIEKPYTATLPFKEMCNI